MGKCEWKVVEHVSWIATIVGVLITIRISIMLSKLRSIFAGRDPITYTPCSVNVDISNKNLHVEIVFEGANFNTNFKALRVDFKVLASGMLSEQFISRKINLQDPTTKKRNPNIDFEIIGTNGIKIDHRISGEIKADQKSDRSNVFISDLVVYGDNDEKTYVGTEVKSSILTFHHFPKQDDPKNA